MTDWPFGLLRRGEARVLYMDPPWQYQSYNMAGVPQRAEAQHYQTMTVDELAVLPVRDLCAPDCAVFVWCTSSHTEQMFWLMRKLGFTFSTKAFCWAKTNKLEHELDRDIPTADNARWALGMGHTSRRNTEDCWQFKLGEPSRRSKSVRELCVSPVREHSRKPDEIYDRIEQLYAGPYVELFGRTRRKGWSTWGNETEKF